MFDEGDQKGLLGALGCWGRMGGVSAKILSGGFLIV